MTPACRLESPCRQAASALAAVAVSAALGGLLGAGCENQPTEVEDYRPEVVMTAFITNGEPVKEVFLERVQPLLEFYDPARAGICGATVRMWRVGGADTLHLTDDPSLPGRYVPAAGAVVIPGSLEVFRLEAVTPQGEHLWAECRVPGRMEEHGPVTVALIDRFGNLSPVHEGDTLHRNMPNLFLIWNKVDSAGGFQGLGLALTSPDSLIPLDPDWTPEDTIPPEDEQRAGWLILREDARMLHLAWILFTWQGPHRLELAALSRDAYEYLLHRFSSSLRSGISPYTNVHGGWGIFGARSVFRMNIVMIRAPN